MKRAFHAFPAYAGWGRVPEWVETLSQQQSSEGTARGGSQLQQQPSGQGGPSLAPQGNFLESINLALNAFERHHLDRDLHRMGQNIVVLTSGSGVYEVHPALAQMTKQRMMDSGIGCDVVSMARPPMHSVPLFVTRTQHFTAAASQPSLLSLSSSGWSASPPPAAAGAPSFLPSHVTVAFSTPHWIHCSFFGHISHGYSALAPSGQAVALEMNKDQDKQQQQGVAQAAGNEASPPATSGDDRNGSSSPTPAPRQSDEHSNSGNAAASVGPLATIPTGGSVPLPVRKNNPLLTGWKAAGTGLLPTGGAAAAPSMVGAPLSEKVTIVEGSGSKPSAPASSSSSLSPQSPPFSPIPLSRLFHCYSPRLTPLGPSFPPALLEVLRRHGRAPTSDLVTAQSDRLLLQLTGGSHSRVKRPAADGANESPAAKRQRQPVWSSKLGDAAASSPPHFQLLPLSSMCGVPLNDTAHEDSHLPSNSAPAPPSPTDTTSGRSGSGSHGNIGLALSEADHHSAIASHQSGGSAAGAAITPHTSPGKETAALSPHLSPRLASITASPILEQEEADGYPDTVNSADGRVLSAAARRLMRQQQQQQRHSQLAASSADAGSVSSSVSPSGSGLARGIQRSRSWRGPSMRTSPYLGAISGGGGGGIVGSGGGRGAARSPVLTSASIEAARDITSIVGSGQHQKRAHSTGSTTATQAGDKTSVPPSQLHDGSRRHLDTASDEPDGHNSNDDLARPSEKNVWGVPFNRLALAPLTSDGIPAGSDVIGTCGSDSLGHVVVEVPPAGVAGQLLPGKKGARDLFQWNRLLQRLHAQAAGLTDNTVAAATEATTTDASTRREVMPSQQQQTSTASGRQHDRRDVSALYAAYRQHDARVFAPRQPASAAAPSSAASRAAPSPYAASSPTGHSGLGLRRDGSSSSSTAYSGPLMTRAAGTGSSTSLAPDIGLSVSREDLQALKEDEETTEGQPRQRQHNSPRAAAAASTAAGKRASKRLSSKQQQQQQAAFLRTPDPSYAAAAGIGLSLSALNMSFGSLTSPQLTGMMPTVNARHKSVNAAAAVDNASSGALDWLASSSSSSSSQLPVTYLLPASNSGGGSGGAMGSTSASALAGLSPPHPPTVSVNHLLASSSRGGVSGKAAGKVGGDRGSPRLKPSVVGSVSSTLGMTQLVPSPIDVHHHHVYSLGGGGSVAAMSPQPPSARLAEIAPINNVNSISGTLMTPLHFVGLLANSPLLRHGPRRMQTEPLPWEQGKAQQELDALAAAAFAIYALPTLITQAASVLAAVVATASSASSSSGLGATLQSSHVSPGAIAVAVAAAMPSASSGKSPRSSSLGQQPLAIATRPPLGLHTMSHLSLASASPGSPSPPVSPQAVMPPHYLAASGSNSSHRGGSVPLRSSLRSPLSRTHLSKEARLTTGGEQHHQQAQVVPYGVSRNAKSRLVSLPPPQPLSGLGLPIPATTTTTNTDVVAVTSVSPKQRRPQPTSKASAITNSPVFGIGLSLDSSRPDDEDDEEEDGSEERGANAAAKLSPPSSSSSSSASSSSLRGRGSIRNGRNASMSDDKREGLLSSAEDKPHGLGQGGGSRVTFASSPTTSSAASASSPASSNRLETVSSSGSLLQLPPAATVVSEPLAGNFNSADVTAGPDVVAVPGNPRARAASAFGPTPAVHAAASAAVTAAGSGNRSMATAAIRKSVGFESEPEVHVIPGLGRSDTPPPLPTNAIGVGSGLAMHTPSASPQSVLDSEPASNGDVTPMVGALSSDVIPGRGGGVAAVTSAAAHPPPPSQSRPPAAAPAVSAPAFGPVFASIQGAPSARQPSGTVPSAALTSLTAVSAPSTSSSSILTSIALTQFQPAAAVGGGSSSAATIATTAYPTATSGISSFSTGISLSSASGAPMQYATSHLPLHAATAAAPYRAHALNTASGSPPLGGSSSRRLGRVGSPRLAAQKGPAHHRQASQDSATSSGRSNSPRNRRVRQQQRHSMLAGVDGGLPPPPLPLPGHLQGLPLPVWLMPSLISPPAAGSLVNPFRRRRGDLVLATANRRRWWHMFPASQLAEQQFTTPAVDSASAGVSKAGSAVDAIAPSGRRMQRIQGDVSGTGTDSHNVGTSSGQEESGTGSSSDKPRAAGVLEAAKRGGKGSVEVSNAPAHTPAASEETSLEELLQGFLPNWKSLLEPAIMPLTTDFLPSPAQLEAQFAVEAYSIILPSKPPPALALTTHNGEATGWSSTDGSGGMDDATSPPRPGSASLTAAAAAAAASDSQQSRLASYHAALVEEMVAQRLVQDFQLVVLTSEGGAQLSPRSPKHDITAEPKLLPSAAKQPSVTTYHLSMGHRIHTIAYDANSGSVEVRMYFKRPAANAAAALSVPLQRAATALGGLSGLAAAAVPASQSGFFIPQSSSGTTGGVDASSLAAAAQFYLPSGSLTSTGYPAFIPLPSPSPGLFTMQSASAALIGDTPLLSSSAPAPHGSHSITAAAVGGSIASFTLASPDPSPALSHHPMTPGHAMASAQPSPYSASMAGTVAPSAQPSPGVFGFFELPSATGQSLGTTPLLLAGGYGSGSIGRLSIGSGRGRATARGALPLHFQQQMMRQRQAEEGSNNNTAAGQQPSSDKEEEEASGTTTAPLQPTPAQHEAALVALLPSEARSALQSATAAERASAAVLALLSRVMAPGFVDATGCFQYRYMLWCPLRGAATVTGRVFRIPRSSAKALARSGTAGGGGSGSGTAGSGGPTAMLEGRSLPIPIPSASNTTAHAIKGHHHVGSLGSSGGRRGLKTPLFGPLGSSAGGRSTGTIKSTGSGGSSGGSGSPEGKRPPSSTGSGSAGNPLLSARSPLMLGGNTAVGSPALHPAAAPPSSSSLSLGLAAEPSALNLATAPSSSHSAAGAGGTPPLVGAVAAAAGSGTSTFLWEREYRWNHLDSLLTGDEDGLIEAIRYKRMHLLLLPLPQMGGAASVAVESDGSSTALSSRCAAFERFWWHVHQRLLPTHGSSIANGKQTTPLATYVPVEIYDPPPVSSGSGGLTGASPKEQASNQPLPNPQSSSAAQVAPASTTSTSASSNAAASTFLLRRRASDDPAATHTIRVDDLRSLSPSPFEWVHTSYGRVFSPQRAFPISIQWVAASGVAVEGLLSGLQRRARQNGFVLVQVPDVTRRALPLAALEGVPLPQHLAEASNSPFDLQSALASQCADASSMAPWMAAVPLSLSLSRNTNGMLDANTISIIHAFESALKTRFGFLEDCCVAAAAAPHRLVRRASSVDGAAAAASDASIIGTSGSGTLRSNNFESSSRGAALIQPGSYRQFVHSSGVAFIRLTHHGAYWLGNSVNLSKLQHGLIAALAPWIAAGRAAAAAAGEPSAIDDDVTIGRSALFRQVQDFCRGLQR